MEGENIETMGLALFIHYVHLCTRKTILCWRTNILRKKKYSAQQADFLSSQKTNNCPKSFPPINSRCRPRLTRLSSSCFVACVSSEPIRRSIVLLKQYSFAYSPLPGWNFQVPWLLEWWKGAVLVPVNSNMILSSLTEP